MLFAIFCISSNFTPKFKSDSIATIENVLVLSKLINQKINLMYKKRNIL